MQEKYTVVRALFQVYSNLKSHEMYTFKLQYFSPLVRVDKHTCEVWT